MMVKSTALMNFGQGKKPEVEAPPKWQSRRFNECDVIGDLDRDDKGNVIAQADPSGAHADKEGKPTNERGYLVDPTTGDIINNLNGETMFSKADIDERGEIPAPFNIEKHNFNPHEVRGDFNYDRNGRPVVQKDGSGNVDKRKAKVSVRGYRLDEHGHMIDNVGRKTFDRAHMTSDGDLPKLFNYNGRRFDIVDTIGQCDKDALGNIIPSTDQHQNLIDNLGRKINSKGYLIDQFGNVIDKDGREIFEKKHLESDEIPKIFPFTKFNVKNVLGDFEMDPLGNPILDKDRSGNFVDRKGAIVNSKGYLVDKDYNVINKYGKITFPKKLLDNEQDIPKVFRTGLLKSDTASSLSRLMSEIGKNQPSEFDEEEQKIQEELAKNMRKKKRGNSGNTSVDSMMEDTPANYNMQNQRFEGQDQEMEDQSMEDESEYGSEYDEVMGMTGMSGAHGVEMAKKKKKKPKKKKKKKKVKKKPSEWEDPSLREHLLAGAYGGIAKPKIKRAGVRYTTDIDAGLRDIATPGTAFIRDPSKKMMTSFSGFANIQHGESARGGGHGSHGRNYDGRLSNRGGSESRSNIGGKTQSIRGMHRAHNDSASKLMDPEQREQHLKSRQMEEIKRLKAAKLEARKRKLAAKGHLTKDADFEKMFGKDIDEFLEDSEWDIESIDKMS
jgi:hypothetical protein